jgi:putative endonuclease
MAFVYILRCCDNSLYIGVTTDLELRLREHYEGVGASHTCKRRPVQLVYSERLESTRAARARERQLKGWTRIKKEALIAGDFRTLKGISRRSRK